MFLDSPPVILVVARLVTMSLVFSMSVDVVVVVNVAIFIMAVVIAAVMAIEYDNIDRVTSAGK